MTLRTLLGLAFVLGKYAVGQAHRLVIHAPLNPGGQTNSVVVFDASALFSAE